MQIQADSKLLTVRTEFVSVHTHDSIGMNRFLIEYCHNQMSKCIKCGKTGQTKNRGADMNY